MILDIVKVPNPILYKRSIEIKKIDSKIMTLIRDMNDTLLAAKDPEGVGLAAPQVGRNVRLFVMRPNMKSAISEFINPLILKIDKTISTKSKVKNRSTLEGCLSVNKIWSPITRPTKIQVKFQTKDAITHTKWFDGFEAVIISHEIDHLDGILFTNRSIEQKRPVYEEKMGKLEEITI